MSGMSFSLGHIGNVSFKLVASRYVEWNMEMKQKFGRFGVEGQVILTNSLIVEPPIVRTLKVKLSYFNAETGLNVDTEHSWKGSDETRFLQLCDNRDKTLLKRLNVRSFLFAYIRDNLSIQVQEKVDLDPSYEALIHD